MLHPFYGHSVPDALIVGCWLVFIGHWNVSAFFAKRSVRGRLRQPQTLRIDHQLAMNGPTRNTKIESTVHYLGIELDDALAIAEQVDA